jgi:hypothetical protein
VAGGAEGGREEEDGKRKEKKEKKRIFLEYTILQFFFCISILCDTFLTPIIHLHIDSNCILRF